MTRALPDGFEVTLADATRRVNGGRTLVGGSPMTVLHLAQAALPLLVDGRVTVQDAASDHVADRLLATNLGQPVPASAMPSAVGDLTVVVPIRDRPTQLDRCLAALAPLAVVVVDDASVEPGAVAAVARRHGARLVALAVNAGPAGARNAGLAEVRTPLVAFVDSDIEVAALSLLDLTRHLADPAVALVGPRVVGRVRSAQPRWFERYDAACSSLTLGHHACAVRPGAAVAWLPSACLVGRVSLLGAGFHTAMRVGEDVDLVWRLTMAEHRVRYAPEVVAHHDVRPTVRGWLGRKFVYGSGGADLARRHGSRTAPAILSPTMALAGAALLLRRQWTPPVVAVALAITTRSVHRTLPRSLAHLTRAKLAVDMSVRGVGWAARQESALLVRHWWPLALFAVPSRNVRRAVVTAMAIDTGVALAQQPDDLTLLPLLVGRRLDDLAYGSGLWWGAVRMRSTAALRPRRSAAIGVRPRAPKRGVGVPHCNASPCLRH